MHGQGQVNPSGENVRLGLPSELGRLCPRESLAAHGSWLIGCDKQGEHPQQESLVFVSKT